MQNHRSTQITPSETFSTKCEGKKNSTDLKFGSTLHIEPDRDLPPRKKKKEKEVTIDICGKEKRLSRKQTFLKEEHGFQLF